ncbi:MAG TPA: aldehyde dehydrogenase family protein, partial [Thermoplasmata archaeon]
MAKAAKPFAKRMFKMYINGKWVESESRDTFNVVSPASGEVIGTFPKGTAEDAKAAVEAAVEAQDAV